MSRFKDPEDQGETGPQTPTEDDMFARDADEFGANKERASRGLTDFVRKKIESTMDQVQTTGSLSKDALSYVIQQGDKGRKEVLRIVAHEVGDFLKNTDLSRELTKVLTGMKVDIKASIAFKAVDADPTTVKPEIDREIKLGRLDCDEDPDESD